MQQTAETGDSVNISVTAMKKGHKLLFNDKRRDIRLLTWALQVLTWQMRGGGFIGEMNRSR